MKSLWSDKDAADTVARYAGDGVNEDLALRVYTTRLLGGDPSLVLHGGGNTSVKTVMNDVLGDSHEVLCVKGSGWDMAVIEPAGLPAVRLEPLRRLQGLDRLSDEDMVAFQRANLLDSASPNPSVETLLHAFLPHKFIDHTHATAVLSVSDQPDGEAICADIYGGRMAIVPFIMPGFLLARKAAEVYAANPDVEGLVLHKHGVFTFGDSAREAYERMIDNVTLAERRIARAGAKVFASAGLPDDPAKPADVAPIVRGACAEDRGDGRFNRLIAEFRSNDAILNFVNGEGVADYGRRGVITPDHIIRTKNRPVVVPPPSGGDLDGWRGQVRAAVDAFADAYHGYFAENNARQDVPKTELDPMPRLVLVPGLGLIGLGKSKKDAVIAADLGEAAVRGITDAEAVGTYESLPESDLFDMEYWSLEQAKLGKGVEKPLARQVALITGGAGAIGAATAKLFAANGAEVAVLDLDGGAAAATAAAIGGHALGLACDVTDGDSVRAAFDAVCETFGGVDIAVSNAGAAWQGGIADLDDDVLRKSFELNFFAHQSVARNAVRIMRAQGTGGVLLFNTSKQAINPGPDFGAYGLPKAATLFLSRQYALEYGAIGIRSNAVNADRIRSGLLSDDMIAARSKARGLSEKDYMSGNLLGREVTADDVAQSFLHQALALKTTADVTTVDGGNIAATLR